MEQQHQQYCIRVLGVTGGELGTSHLYVQDFDADGHGGMGTIKFTHLLERALKFPDQAEAVRYYQQESKVKPMRPDGKPNRPLTAFTVEIVLIDEPEAA